MSHFPYHFFQELVVRTPFFTYKDFHEIVSKDEISDIELKEICENSIFQEAVFLASPYLYEEINHWISGKEYSSKEYQRLKNTILKYYTRMSTRCTPFGLFSGVGLGAFDLVQHDGLMVKEQELQATTHQQPVDHQLRDTKLDMHFLVALSEYFVTIPRIKNKIHFFPNNSIYRIGNRIRYIEYEYNNGKRDYIISSAQLSEQLQQILDFSNSGKLIDDIAEILIDSEITKNDAIEFIDELIENQVLVSELEPNVSGPDFLERLISISKEIGNNHETEILFSIQGKLQKLDQNMGNPISKYTEIEELIKHFPIEYEQKYLFQTDLYRSKEFNLSPHWKKKLKKGISFLNKISLPNEDSHFSAFKKAFNERFETQEVPLALALDTEIGIGYRQNTAAKGIHPYLEDLKLPIPRKKQNQNLQLTPILKILNEKLQDALIENQLVIELSDVDFEDFQESWSDLPDTISFMTEIISEGNEEKLYISSNSGSSAANLLGRFCSEESKIQSLAQNITQKEKELNLDVILAEVIHLPEARIGNIIRRPTLRPYEIPYLAQSVVPKENQIPLDDLYISLKNNEIVLRSKSLNKEIKAYLSNAHNYYTNTLPIYHFLSDLHTQNTRTGLYFDWGDLSKIYKFLPRIEYDNIILSKAQWHITEKDIISLETIMDNKKQTLSELRVWRNKRRIPQWIQWMKYDNTLPMNLENHDFAKLFIQTVKSEKSIIIEEVLYNKNDDYRREFIFPIYRKEKFQN